MSGEPSDPPSPGERRLGLVATTAIGIGGMVGGGIFAVLGTATTLPRAYYASVGFVTLLYILLAAITVGSLSPAEIAGQEEYALAAAARPSLGALGFTLVSIAALLSTAPAINATIYGNARLTLVLAEEGELPHAMERRVWHRPVAAVLATAALSLVLANGFDVRAIAIVASAGLLLIFTTVNFAATRLANSIDAQVAITATAAVSSAAAFLTLVFHANQESPHGLALIAGSIIGCVVAEAAVQHFGGQSFASGRRSPR